MHFSPLPQGEGPGVRGVLVNALPNEPAMISDCIQHRIQIIDYISIQKSDHCVPLSTQPTCPFLVIQCSCSMAVTIQFDNQPALSAEEIDYEPTNWMLSSKLESRQTAISQVVPELSFSVCGFPSQLPCQ